jgi:hypothetical protein
MIVTGKELLSTFCLMLEPVITTSSRTGLSVAASAAIALPEAMYAAAPSRPPGNTLRQFFMFDMTKVPLLIAGNPSQVAAILPVLPKLGKAFSK